MGKKDRPPVWNGSNTVPDYDHFGWPEDYEGYIWPVKLWYIAHNYLPLRYYKWVMRVEQAIIICSIAILFLAYVSGTLTGGGGRGY